MSSGSNTTPISKPSPPPRIQPTLHQMPGRLPVRSSLKMSNCDTGPSYHLYCRASRSRSARERKWASSEGLELERVVSLRLYSEWWRYVVGAFGLTDDRSGMSDWKLQFDHSNFLDGADSTASIKSRHHSTRCLPLRGDCAVGANVGIDANW
jgi:hypothetical protein